ncbi:hypothetical protein BU17DRAFT_72333 [Hysterangium stoloniferum]|nr:hypothetical protein BU17DRAFT_72333 [Hysterangium stoloniferum]
MVLNVIGDIFGTIILPIGLASFLTTPGLFSTESKHLNKIITSTMTMKPLAFNKPIGGPKWDHSDRLDTPIGSISNAQHVYIPFFLTLPPPPPYSDYCHSIYVNTTSHTFLSVILHHYILDTQFRVSDILTDMLNLEQVMGLFGWLPQCVSGGGSYLLPAMLSLTGYLPIRLHPFSKGSLATVLMSKPFGGRTQQRRSRATRAACTHRGDDLSHPAVIGSACIALIHITLAFTLLGVIVYFAHSRLQKAHMTGTSKAPMRLITHPVNDSNVEGIDTADHAPAVDEGNIEGANAPDCLPAVDNGSVESTDADPDSTPRISREDKGKGVGLREYGPLMLDGSLFMGSLAQRIGQGFSNANTTFRPKSQTASHDIVHVDDGNVKGANEDPDYPPRPNDETFHISPKTNTTIHPKSQTAGDDGSEYMVPVSCQSSFIDDDDEATDQKVLACMSMQTDLSPAFGSYTSLLFGDLQKLIKSAIIADMPVIALLPVVPFVHHVVTCQLNPPHVSASATNTAMDSEWINDHGCGEGASGGLSSDLPSHDGTGHGGLAGRAYEQPGSCAEAKVFTSSLS